MAILWGDGVKDAKTKLDLILSGATFENACAFIETRYTITYAHDVCDTAGALYTVFDTEERGPMIFDESRGLLLGA